MKTLLIAASFLFFAAGAQGQTRIAGGAPPSQLTFSGGGIGGGMSGIGPVAFNMSTAGRPVTHYSYVYAQGSNATFEPTRFVSFEAAVKLGKEALAYRPKTIVEVAAECRAAKKKAAN